MKPQSKWLSYKSARSYIHGLKLKSAQEWYKYCQSGNKPDNIPSSAKTVYKNKGWTNWQNWLGYEKPLKTKARNWESYTNAKVYTHKLKLKSKSQWFNYKNNGWVSWQDWLGYEKGWEKPSRDWPSYESAREFVHTLKLKSQTEWITFCKSSNRPEHIAAVPSHLYKNNGWVDWQDWLGYEKISYNQKKDWLSYKDACQYIHKLKLKSIKEWKCYSRGKEKPANIPKCPQAVYKNDGWVDWQNWLGYEKISYKQKKDWLSYNKARRFARKLKLKSIEEWNDYLREKEKPANIPKSPQVVYKNDGWVDWYDWLGKPRHHFTPFKKARKITRSLKIRSEPEWFEACKKDLIPDNLPVNPHIVYDKEGWEGWQDWCG